MAKVIGFIDPKVLKGRMTHSRRVRRDKPLTVSFGAAIRKALSNS